VIAQVRGSAREEKARASCVVWKEHDRDGRGPSPVRRRRAAREAREMLAGPRAQCRVEAVETYLWLE
jgi:hypothetical protein